MYVLLPFFQEILHSLQVSMLSSGPGNVFSFGSMHTLKSSGLQGSVECGIVPPLTCWEPERPVFGIITSPAS